MLRLPAVADKTFLITIGDRTVAGLVARDQMVGPWQVPVADAAVTAASFDGYVRRGHGHGRAHARWRCSTRAASARMAVGEAITNIAAAPYRQSRRRQALRQLDGRRPATPARTRGLYDAVQAVGMELCPALGIAIPVGKDSMSMSTVWQQSGEAARVTAPLSLIVTAFAPVTRRAPRAHARSSQRHGRHASSC